MKRLGALTIGVAMTVAACGGSDETAPKPDVALEAVDDDGGFRQAGGDVQVISGCRIETYTVCKGADLTDADLRGADLQFAILSGADLSGADLSGANLMNATLSLANLMSAYLLGANLQRVNLYDANLSYANLMEADLSGANLEGAFMEFTAVQGAAFCNTTMPDGSVDNDNC